jgi:hypothetical protein
MIPSIGRIVHYTLTEYDAQRVLDQRKYHKSIVAELTGRTWPEHVFHGNQPSRGDVYPMLITRVWDRVPTEESCVQGQVFLDGNDTLWVTSVTQKGHTFDPDMVEGLWFEPPQT